MKIDELPLQEFKPMTQIPQLELLESKRSQLHLANGVTTTLQA